MASPKRERAVVGAKDRAIEQEGARMPRSAQRAPGEGEPRTARPERGLENPPMAPEGARAPQDAP